MRAGTEQRDNDMVNPKEEKRDPWCFWKEMEYKIVRDTQINALVFISHSDGNEWCKDVDSTYLLTTF